jgi:hypothetical protein
LIGGNEKKIWKYNIDTQWADELCSLKSECYQTAGQINEDLIMIFGKSGSVDIYSISGSEIVYQLKGIFFEKLFKKMKNELLDENFQSYLML